MSLDLSANPRATPGDDHGSRNDAEGWEGAGRCQNHAGSSETTVLMSPAEISKTRVRVWFMRTDGSASQSHIDVGAL